ncbi:MAG: tRNA pseudouridine(38-40) synthase TruA [Proteobacteria bacterium]|nr:tRNA pseudouridine(38-40) synthase TruA [Pseudomonadota bacterium]
MRTIKLLIEYDGTHLSGWQRQKNGPSVQQHLEEAVAHMTGTPVPVIGASRTDAGVHARGQVAHFRTESAIPTYGFRRGINGMVPSAIAVIGCEEAPTGFHARFDSRGKHYRYTLLTRRPRSPLWNNRAWHRPRPLDFDAMTRAAQFCVGEMDFAAFRASGCQAATSVRTINAIEIARPDSQIAHIDVRGNAFLRNMVRILAGTLVAVGEGQICAADIPAVVASRDRSRAGQTAPAHGLTLMQVFYDHPAESSPTSQTFEGSS